MFVRPCMCTCRKTAFEADPGSRQGLQGLHTRLRLLPRQKRMDEAVQEQIYCTYLYTIDVGHLLAVFSEWSARIERRDVHPSAKFHWLFRVLDQSL